MYAKLIYKYNKLTCYITKSDCQHIQENTMDFNSPLLLKSVPIPMVLSLLQLKTFLPIFKRYTWSVALNLSKPKCGIQWETKTQNKEHKACMQETKCYEIVSPSISHSFYNLSSMTLYFWCKSFPTIKVRSLEQLEKWVPFSLCRKHRRKWKIKMNLNLLGKILIFLGRSLQNKIF